MRKSTNKFDVNGKEIFVGDHVTHWWGYGQDGYNFKYHKINIRPAHLMSNNKWHDDGGGIIFNMGCYYNFWEGKDVVLISELDLAKFILNGIEPDSDFIDEYKENKKYNTPIPHIDFKHKL